MSLGLIIYSISKSNIEFYKKSLLKLDYKAHIATSYSEFTKILQKESAHLIIIDLDLDNTDAITVIKELKQQENTREIFVIVCSNKVDDFIQISALNSGADDFINLPVNTVIFESKIKSIIKRIGKEKKEALPYFYIDKEQYKIVMGNQSYYLPRLEFKLVNLLCSHPNKVFSKEEIAGEIWKNKDISSKRTIDIHVRNIRKELGQDIIKTYRGMGYSFNSK